MRLKQWVKNGFVLAPLLFAGAFADGGAIANSIYAAMLFCLASSAAYIVNDMRDVDFDRRHPKKCKTRPLVIGSVSLRSALALLLLLYAAIAFGWFAFPRVGSVIGCYLAVNLVYSFFLKHQPVLDIFTIAVSFVLRVYAGAMAIVAPVSGWMLITTLCLALFLATVKRRQELLLVGAEGRRVLTKYEDSLIDRYAVMSSTCTLVFYGMFVLSARPQLVFTIPLVLFGMFRYWYVVVTLEGGESPTDVVLADRPMLVAITMWIGACVWALWPMQD